MSVTLLTCSGCADTLEHPQTHNHLLPSKLFCWKHAIMSLLPIPGDFPELSVCSAGMQTGQSAGDIGCLLTADSA